MSNDGGLYEAVLDGNSTAMVLPPYQINSFADLNPRIPGIAIVNTAQDLVELIGAIKRWTKARFAGNVISTIRRDAVLAALEHAVVASVCGKAWQLIEDDILMSQISLSALTNQIVPGSDRGFGRLVLETRHRLVEATPAETASLLLALSARVLVNCLTCRRLLKKKRNNAWQFFCHCSSYIRVFRKVCHSRAESARNLLFAMGFSCGSFVSLRFAKRLWPILNPRLLRRSEAYEISYRV